MSNSQNIIEAVVSNLNNYDSGKVLFVQRTRFRQKKWTTRDVIALISLIIEFHSQKKLNSGDKVVICAPNSPYWGSIFLACAMRNIVVVPLDFNSSDEFINKIINTVSPKILYISKYKDAKIKEKTDRVYLEDLEEFIPYKEGLRLSTPKFNPDSLLEIVYTSGSTGHPKGAMISYDNVSSNINNLLEIFRPHKNTKLLSIIPLSHMFEQTIGFFVPLKLGLQIVYPYSLTSKEITNALNENCISTVVCVPAFIKIIKDAIERKAKQKNKLSQLDFFLSLSSHLPFAFRRLLFHSIHASLGGHLQELYVGGAPLDREIEDFWDNLGVQIIQGYGLTECSPLVTMNVARYYKKYSVGKCVPNQEIKLLQDGEILVKGRNVFLGYYKEPRLTKGVFRNSWFYTGDLGEQDEKGNLFIKGRKKNVIVNTAGMKIYPEDIELKLNQFSEVKDSIVVGLEEHHAIVITAIIIPKEKTFDTKRIIETVNKTLASHQKIQKTVLWKDSDFPRTPTRKIIRYKVLEILKSSEKDQLNAPTKNSSNILIKIMSEISNAPQNEISSKTNLVSDLHLDSIKRLELLSRIQEELHGEIDEQLINQYSTVGEVEKNIKKTQMYSGIIYPSWQLNSIVVFIRSILQLMIFLFLRSFQKLDVGNKNILESQKFPIIFIVNHTSHLDTPTILKSLPTSIRQNICVGAAKDYFFKSGIAGFFMKLIFNGFPIDRETNITETMTIIGNLLNKQKSILIFPEGTRSSNGKLAPFKKGVGILALEMSVPIIPVRIIGNFEILPKGRVFPKFGKTKVVFGEPIKLPKKISYIEATDEIEKRILKL